MRRPTAPSASRRRGARCMRIAKEGRKYGVYLGLVTQRPGELDPTIISQCNTLFAMRLANERDQALLRSAVTDAVANLLDFIPSLGTREVVAFGEGLPLPTRLRFAELPAERLPHSETVPAGGLGRGDRRGARLRAPGGRALARRGGRRAAGRGSRPGAAPEPSAAPRSRRRLDPHSASARLEQLRAQILKRGPGAP